MDLKSTLRVEEVLRRPLFENAVVVAGKEGLSRIVRWVHILEISNFDQLIHGEEMILMTGVAFQSDVTSFVAYVEKLVSQNASCLCIELGEYFRSVPEELIEAADRFGFPLIIFRQTVRFIDITQDLHSLIINRHHAILKDLERISREFHRLTLTSQGIANVLKLLHTSTSAQVIYLPVKAQPHFVPAVSAPEPKKMLDFIDARLQDIRGRRTGAEPFQWKYGDCTMIGQPVGAVDIPWAYIVIVLNRQPEEYDYLILDSASVSISQDLLMRRYTEERKLYTDNLWIDDVIHHRIKEEEIKSLTGSDFKKMNESDYRVCLIEFDRSEEDRWTPSKLGADSIDIHLSMLLRSLLEQHSFLPLITLKKNGLVVVAIDQNPRRSSKSALGNVFEMLRSLLEGEQNGKSVKLLISIGGSYVKLINAHLSYREALHTLELYPCFEDASLFFEDLGVFQLLYSFADKTVLQTFVDRYLGRLIEHDLTKGGELVRTLKVYLEHNGSKQVAAQKLFIVRQSLYYRLEKIKELLDSDFMNPENRLALQLAVRAYQLLNPDKWVMRNV